MNIPQVEGLTALEGPRRSRLAGSKFALPPSFDAKKYASKWVEQGPGVLEAQQSTVLDFAGCEAQGWTVFKVLKVERGITNESEDSADAKTGDNEGSEIESVKKRKSPQMVPCTRAVGKAVFVLMFRPKNLQLAVNKLYAGQSRQIVNREILGETNAVNEGNDAGILTNADLRKHSRDLGDEPEGYLPATSGQRPKEAVELNIS